MSKRLEEESRFGSGSNSGEEQDYAMESREQRQPAPRATSGGGSASDVELIDPLPQKRGHKAKELMKIFCQMLKDAYIDSKIHGISNIVKATNWFTRIFWILLVLGALGGAAYFCYLSTNSFFTYETTTSISIVTDTPVDFP
jgi:hypothetical protein